MIPEIPAQVEGVRVQGMVPLRYEDVRQDGRLALLSIPPTLGVLIWPALMALPDAAEARSLWIVPILSRMLIEVGQGPLSAVRPMRGTGVSHNAKVLRPSGEVERLLLLMWASLEAQEGATHSQDPPGPWIFAGRVYAEHVYTRLFGESSDRRVRDLPSGLPSATWPWTPFEQVALPPATEPFHTFADPLFFGLPHTDANMHVNSLVYPRILEEHVLSHCAALPNASELSARTVEMMWRKPFFAGETAVLHVELYRDGEQVVACGRFVDNVNADRCRIRILLAP